MLKLVLQLQGELAYNKSNSGWRQYRPDNEW